MTQHLPQLLAGTVFVALLSACANHSQPARQQKDSAPNVTLNLDAIHNAVPRVEKKSKYGNPKSYVVFGKRYYPLQSSQGFVQTGTASWYGTKFHGRKTSSGERYDMYAMTAAHKTLPLPTYVEVTNQKTGQQIIVKVNDRGPFHDDRIIDLSYAAASKLGFGKSGTAHVKVKALDPRVKIPTPTVKKAIAPTPIAKKTAPSPTKKPAAMYLQVGSFNSRLNAESLRHLILDMATMPVHISANDNRFRVRVGPLSGDAEAERISAMLTMIGVNKPSVVYD